jgi:hypothetical protein
VNDSGNDTVVYAVDSTGRDLGTFRLPGAVNRDWEAIALGPCPAGSCLLIGDIGDNLEQRQSVTLYRLPEPTVAADDPAGVRRTAAVDSIRVRYPDGPHDVEGLYVDAKGDAYLVSKGRSRGIRLFRVGADAWSGAETVAAFVQSVPIVPDVAIGQWVTDAALSPDGMRVWCRAWNLREKGSRGSTIAACSWSARPREPAPVPCTCSSAGRADELIDAALAARACVDGACRPAHGHGARHDAGTPRGVPPGGRPPAPRRPRGRG